MTLAFDVGGCSVLVEPSDQGRKPQPVTAHNRHYAFLVVPGHGLLVTRLTGCLTVKLEGYEN